MPLMEEMEFDKTRKSIGSDKLAGKDRKNMLGKFTGAGGQVMDEQSIRKQQQQKEAEAASKGGGRGGSKGHIDVKLPSELAREKNRQVHDKESHTRNLREREKREAQGFLNRFFIKLNCSMKGYTPFGQDMVKPKCLSLLNLDAKRALMECQILGNDLFSNNATTARKIISELDDKNPLLVELLERGTDLYSRTELSELTGSYSPGSNQSLTLGSLRPGIFALLRKLYYFRAHIETYPVAADLAINIQQKIENKHAGLYAAKKKKIRQEWRVLMNSIYPMLTLLAQRAEMLRAEPGSRLFEEMIGIIDEDRLGNREAGDSVGSVKEEKADKSEDEDSEDEKKEDKSEDMSKELEYGYKILKLYPVDTLRKKHDPKGEFVDISSKDKVFLSLMFFREFEEEYSFILTTPKIKLNVTYQSGAKLDYHQKMTDLFEESRMVHDAYKKYMHDSLEYKKVESEAGLAANHMEHTKKLEKYEGKLGSSGQEAKIQVTDYADKVLEIFDILIKDMRGPGEIILNKDDTIQFDLAQDKRKRLNGKPVKTSIMQAYCCLLALTDRVRSGDLYGGVLEMSDEDFSHAFKQVPKPDPKPSDETEEKVSLIEDV